MLRIATLQTGFTVGEIAGFIAGAISVCKYFQAPIGSSSPCLISQGRSTNGFTSNLRYCPARPGSQRATQPSNMVRYQPSAPINSVAFLAPRRWLSCEARSITCPGHVCSSSAGDPLPYSGSLSNTKTSQRTCKGFARDTIYAIYICSR